MKFSGRVVPEELFEIARNMMRTMPSFTPEEVRWQLVTRPRAATLIREVTTLQANDRVLAHRVTRAVIDELVAAGDIKQLKRGVWMATRVWDAAEQQASAQPEQAATTRVAP